eukprot:5825976-Prymnesium_polylepis.1
MGCRAREWCSAGAAAAAAAARRSRGAFGSRCGVALGAGWPWCAGYAAGREAHRVAERRPSPGAPLAPPHCARGLLVSRARLYMAHVRCAKASRGGGGCLWDVVPGRQQLAARRSGRYVTRCGG